MENKTTLIMLEDDNLAVGMQKLNRFLFKGMVDALDQNVRVTVTLSAVPLSAEEITYYKTLDKEERNERADETHDAGQGEFFSNAENRGGAI